MSVAASQGCILRVADGLTGRRFPVRVGADEAALPLGELLDRYLRAPDVLRLLGEGRITPRGAETLQDVQDLVYTVSDAGELGGSYPGVLFRQGEETADLRDPPAVETAMLDARDVAVVDVEVDRLHVGYDRNWVGFHRRRWEREAATYADFVRRSVVRGRSQGEADEILALSEPGHEMALVRSLARAIWESDFESYSRFVGGRLRYKTGDQTVRNIIDGGGGICSEKVQALKFLTDRYGIRSEYVLAGPDVPGPVPEERLRELLTTFDFRLRRRYLRYWQHTALLYTIGGAPVLVDATNGNIPFLFLRGERAERVLGYEDKPPVTVRMAVYQDDSTTTGCPRTYPKTSSSPWRRGYRTSTWYRSSTTNSASTSPRPLRDAGALSQPGGLREAAPRLRPGGAGGGHGVRRQRPVDAGVGPGPAAARRSALGG